MADTKLKETVAARPRETWLICLLLAAAVFLVFLPVRHFEFINYDDPDYVASNSHVQQGFTVENLKWAFSTKGHASNWHPLTWLSHTLDWQIFKDYAGGHHLMNVLFHAANTLLLFVVLRKMTNAVWRSAFIAALFALHPLHVESVAWIAERKDVLSTFFWMLTMWAYARHAQMENEKWKMENTQTGRASVYRSPFSILHSPFFALALLFFALGLMAKPMVVTLPFALLLLDFWPLQRVFSLQFSVSDPKRPAAENWKLNTEYLRGIIIEKLPFFALVIISSALTFQAQKEGGAVTSLNALPVATRVSNALISYPHYLWKMVWPRDLAVLYPHPWKTQPALATGAALFLIIATTFALSQWRRRPFLIVGWFWFLGTLVPVIGLVQVGLQAIADRYTYVPLIGIFVLITWTAGEFALRSKKPIAIVACGILTACVIGTRIQLGYWHDSGTLFSHAVAITKKNFLAHNNLGYYLYNKGKEEESAAGLLKMEGKVDEAARKSEEAKRKMAEALEHYDKAMKSYPDFDLAYNNMGYALAEQGRVQEAIPFYQRALQLKPQSADVHNNIGNALGSAGRVQESMEHYYTALKLDPENADAHNNLGVALAMQGQLEDGARELKEGLRLKPKNAGAHSNLGNIYAIQGKYDEAIDEYLLALQLKPDDAQAHNNLGNALSAKNRTEEAIAHYEKALQLNANNPEAECNLGLALVKLGKLEEARKHLQEAVRLKPDYAQAREQLALLDQAKR